MKFSCTCLRKPLHPVLCSYACTGVHRKDAYYYPERERRRQVDMQDDLTFVEQAAIFFHVANPASELQNALQENLNEPVMVVQADDSSAEVIISSFAQVTQSGGITTMTTPAFSFARAERGHEAGSGLRRSSPPT